MKLEILNLGGIATLRCTWSIQTAPAIISTFLYLHNIVIISLTSSLTFPYSVFFLYFGMKTIWYWHFQRVCDMLLLSIWTASYSLSWLATPYSLYHRRLFLDILTVSTYTILPSIAGGLVLSIISNLALAVYVSLDSHLIVLPLSNKTACFPVYPSCRKSAQKLKISIMLEKCGRNPPLYVIFCFS